MIWKGKLQDSAKSLAFFGSMDSCEEKKGTMDLKPATLNNHMRGREHIKLEKHLAK